MFSLVLGKVCLNQSTEAKFSIIVQHFSAKYFSLCQDLQKSLWSASKPWHGKVKTVQTYSSVSASSKQQPCTSQSKHIWRTFRLKGRLCQLFLCVDLTGHIDNYLLISYLEERTYFKVTWWLLGWVVGIRKIRSTSANLWLQNSTSRGSRDFQKCNILTNYIWPQCQKLIVWTEFYNWPRNRIFISIFYSFKGRYSVLLYYVLFMFHI